MPTRPPDRGGTPGFHFTAPNHKNWAPRLGFAYRITEKTVFRGGGGIYYNPNQTNSYHVPEHESAVQPHLSMHLVRRDSRRSVCRIRWQSRRPCPLPAATAAL